MRVWKIAVVSGAAVLMVSGATIAGAQTQLLDQDRDKVQAQTCLAGVANCDQTQDRDRLQDGTCDSTAAQAKIRAAKRVQARDGATGDAAQTRTRTRAQESGAAPSGSGTLVATQTQSRTQTKARTQAQSQSCDQTCDGDQIQEKKQSGRN